MRQPEYMPDPIAGAKVPGLSYHKIVAAAVDFYGREPGISLVGQSV
jgi:hypothetical protein